MGPISVSYLGTNLSLRLISPTSTRFILLCGQFVLPSFCHLSYPTLGGKSNWTPYLGNLPVGNYPPLAEMGIIGTVYKHQEHLVTSESTSIQRCKKCLAVP